MDEDALVTQLDAAAEKFLPTGGKVRSAAAEAYQAKLREWRAREPDIEFSCSVPEGTVQRVFVGLCQRYGLTPYRRPRQRRTTVCIRAPRGFLHELFWPQFEELAEMVDIAVLDSVERVVEKWTGRDFSDRFGPIPGHEDEPLEIG